MTQLSVFIASSVDGYIAAPDGDLGWLEAATRPDEDYGYDEFLATVDGLAMGRSTYDHIAHLDPLPFGGRPVFVFTHRAFVSRSGVTSWAPSPNEAAHAWAGVGLARVYVDGGQLISQFLGEGLIDDMTLITAPVVLGRGRPLFHPFQRTIGLKLTSVRSWPSGFTSRAYAR